MAAKQKQLPAPCPKCGRTTGSAKFVIFKRDRRALIRIRHYDSQRYKQKKAALELAIDSDGSLDLRSNDLVYCCESHGRVPKKDVPILHSEKKFSSVNRANGKIDHTIRCFDYGIEDQIVDLAEEFFLTNPLTIKGKTRKSVTIALPADLTQRIKNKGWP